MALTLNINTVDTNASPFDGGTMGKRMLWRIELTSDVSLAKKRIYFNPAFWLELESVSDAVITEPQIGYSQIYPTSPLSQQMTLTKFDNDGNHRLASNPSLTNTDNFTFEINTFFFNTFDKNNFFAEFTTLNNERLIKNRFDNPLILSNVLPAVYNTAKIMRAQIVVVDADTGMVDDFTYVDFEFESRFYEQGLGGSIPSEYTDWSFEAERASGTVSNLSVYENTTLKFEMDIGGGTVISAPELLIIRTDLISNTSGWFADSEAAYYDGGSKVLGLPAYVASHVGWTNTIGTFFEATYEIDKDVIVNGASYRFIIIADAFGGSFSNSFITPVLQVNAAPDATTGTMAGEIKDYNDIYTGNCLVATAYERLQACVTVDKDSYDLELAGKGISGDFDSNFQSVEIVLTAAVGTLGEILRVDTITGSPSITVTDTGNDYKICFDFRFQPEWIGQVILIDFFFTYNLIINPGLPTEDSWSDIIQFRQTVNANPLQEDTPVASQVLTDLSFEDGLGNELKEICEDTTQILGIVTKIATVNDYNLIVAFKRDDVGVQPTEREDYALGIIPQLQENPFTFVDVTFSGTDAQFTLEPGFLDDGVKYRVIAIAKEENPTPPTICPIITMRTITEVSAVSNPPQGTQVDLDIDFEITGFGGATVTAVAINTTTNPVANGPNQNDNFVSDTGSYTYTATFLGGYTGTPMDVILQVDISLDNGCLYTGYIVRHTIIPLVGNITNIAEGVNPD